MNSRTLADHFRKFLSFSGHVKKCNSIWRDVEKSKSLPDDLMKYKSLPPYLLKFRALSQYFLRLISLWIHFLKLKSGFTRSIKFKIENVRGRHVVMGGLFIYLLSFLIGIGSTGITLEDADTPPDDLNSQEATNIKVTEELWDIDSAKDSNVNDSSSSVANGSYDIHETTVPGKSDSGISLNRSKVTATGSMESKFLTGSPEMTIPVTFLKKIFLNNLGLNIIIITGAFSLLAFSMIVLVFNALQVGMLVKGIYNSYGLRLAATLVLPHLMVEVISHLLSLYLAYLILRQIIVPVVINGEGMRINPSKALKIMVLLSLITIITLTGALVEIYLTPKLI